MKNFIFYLVGAMLLFVSCQSDQLESDEALVQENDAILMKALESLKDYDVANQSPMVSKSVNANQVSKNWKMLYSRGTVGVVVNSDPYLPGSPDSGCDGEGGLQFVVDGGGIASLIGKFSVMNLACVDEGGNFVTPLYGWITAANGDVIHTMLTNVTPDLSNPGFATYRYMVVGGSEGGRFEAASGWLDIYGNSTEQEFEFVGVGGELIY